MKNNKQKNRKKKNGLQNDITGNMKMKSTFLTSNRER